MLKSSQLYKNLRKPMLGNLARAYNYQTELYAKKFEIRDAKLEEELRQVNRRRSAHPQLSRFIEAYHQHGVKLARLDPLEQHTNTNPVPELDPATYGLEKTGSYSTEGLLFGNEKSMSVDEIESYLKNTYSSNMAIEFSFINNEEEKLWIAKEFEALSAQQVENKAKIDMLKLLINSQVFTFYFLDFLCYFNIDYLKIY
jgi:probable 2-oxoglutarate dehydrogenase E1 component DHKTD1